MSLDVERLEASLASSGSKPLKILMLGSTYPRHEADIAVSWRRETVRRLTARGHELSVMAPSFRGPARATPGGETCPVLGVVAANALAWLVGFFALFAPGGLVVREACLAGLLTAWIPAEQAVVVALAWRLVRVVSEMVVFALVAVSGLPERLRPASASELSPARAWTTHRTAAFGWQSLKYC